MFTGLVQETATVESCQPAPGGHGVRLVVRSALPAARTLPLGASIALNGACMTIVQNEVASAPSSDPSSGTSLAAARLLSFEVSPESLARTGLGQLRAGSAVHVECALCAGDPLGGHMLSGHVDGMGRIVERRQEGEYLALSIALEPAAQSAVAPYLVEKGSVGVDGVSLTVNAVHDLAQAEGLRTVFTVMLIPHTLAQTHLGRLEPGQLVNLEADLMAKYVNRYQSYGPGLRA